MNSTPSIDQILEGMIISLGADIMPNLTTAKAQASAAMMQSMLQGLRQILPVYDQYLAEEHNQMTQVLRDTAAGLASTPGPAAERVRQRAATLGAREDLPLPASREALMAAHEELSKGLEATIVDLDELQRAGDPTADRALDIVRTHLGARVVRDTATFLVGEGMLGRN